MGGDSSSNRAAQLARMDEHLRQAKIEGGTNEIRKMFAKQFGDKYYADLSAAGTGMYTPQVNDQYEKSLRDLQAALYRTGNADSTVALQMKQGLDDQRERALLDIQNSVQGTVNQRRQNVANAEMGAVGQLTSSADAAAAAAQARNLINTNSQPEAWSPLGQVFTDATAGLATQAELERSGKNRYDFGVSTLLNRPRRYTTNVGI